MSEISDLAAHCIRCGFCIEACPTFVTSGQETESPRGRIYLIRNADEGKIAWEDIRPHIDRCLGCRACETACPSGVEYGSLLELARQTLEDRKPERSKHFLLNSLSDPLKMRLSLLASKLIPQKLSLRLFSSEPAQVAAPKVQTASGWPPLNESDLPPIGGQILLLEGCVMGVMYPRVHEATRRLLRRVGYEAINVEGCCGALHAHNGYLTEAKVMAERLGTKTGNSERPTPNAQRLTPLITNSAGCGSWLKDHGDIAVQDIAEFLFENGLRDLLKSSSGLDLKASYHDACHLTHGQGVRSQPRQLLDAIPGLTLIPLQEADMCCGSAGIYNILQPTRARQLLDRKWANIECTGAEIVVMGNPGCHSWIAQAAQEHGSRVRVLHTAEMLEAAFSGLPG